MELIELPQPKPLEYHLLSPAHMQGALDCLCSVFPRHEPLTAHLEVPEGEFRAFASELLAHALPAQLSWVALRGGRVAGVRVVTDLSDDFLPGRGYGSRMDLILDFLEEVSRPLKEGREGLQGRAVHSHMMAVESRLQGSGIAKGLLARASGWAAGFGYAFNVGEVTHSHNHRVLARIPSFRPLHAIRFAEYIADGSSPFAGITGHEACTLYRFALRDLC